MSVATLKKNLTRAHREWIAGAEDERYLSLDDRIRPRSFGAPEPRPHHPDRSLVARGSEEAGGALTLEQEDVGLRHLAGPEKVQLMSQPGETSGQSLRCLVGPDYGRIYDYKVVRAVSELNRDNRWRVPAASGLRIEAQAASRSGGHCLAFMSS